MSRQKFSEGSAMAPSRDSRNNAQAWKKSRVMALQEQGNAQAIKQIARQVSKLRRRVVGGGGSTSGLIWQTPNRELDPSVSVSENTLVYISPNNPLVSTGLKDLDTGDVEMAIPGIWCAMVDIPSQVTVSSVINYNVPKEPVVGSVTGTPLSGDMDTDLVKWKLIQEYSPCLA